MNPGLGTAPPASAQPSRTRARLEELETALRHARADRTGQVASIEEELQQLHRIYERMTSDLASVRAERDHALETARLERERRARETLELSEKLEAALRESGPRAGAPSPEAFVLDRLGNVVQEHKKLEPGEMPTVPGYRILGPLGQGGMATVWHAVAEKDNREVAVKVLHDGLGASAGRMELFLREAAAMLQLSHPGLVGAIDAGDSPHGRYLVLELVRGESLAALVRRCGPLPEKEAIRVALQVARALAYCARLGLTHRDVKPSNLLMDTTGRVRLCDFGLAALSFGSDPARPYGSPGYAAPEQISNPTSIDDRVDIYALGATLWHLVVGRRPFQGTPKQVFELQKTQDLSDPRFEGADISPRLAQVVRRMGRAQRDRRYRRWDECILDLMLVENGNPPFSAHLAEALEPGNALTSGPVEPSPPAAPAPAAAPPAAPPTLERHSEIAHTVLPPPAPSPLRGAAPWFLVCALCAFAAVFGYAAATMTRPSAVTEIETRARRLAAQGDPDAALRALHAAAPLLDPADRDHLLRVAAELAR